MIVISLKEIGVSFGVNTVLENVTFSIDEGQKVALIGANGAGKSTLFKVLTEEIKDYTGEVFIDKEKTVGYLSQSLNLNSSNNVYQEALLVFKELTDMEEKMQLLQIEMEKPYDEENETEHNKIISDFLRLQELYNLKGGFTYKGETHKVLTGLGFLEEDFNKKIEVMSGGEKTRLALAKLLLSSPNILLLDEPTNHLDLEAIEWLEEYLSSYKGTILIISHDRYFLDKVTTHTFEMVNGMVFTYNAPYTKFLELKEKNYEVLHKAYSKQQKEIKRQKEIIKRYQSFNREKSIRAAESRQKVLDKMELLEKPPQDDHTYKLAFKSEIQSGNDVLFVENLSKSFDDNLLFENITFKLEKEDRIALIGENGRGKTTLLKIILDKIKADSGNVHLGQNVTLGYYDQEQENLNIYNDIFSEIHDEFPYLTEREVRTSLGRFLFTGEEVFKEISTLSGGEKCRVSLLKLMLKKSNFLILDEPTNHLDIPSREVLEDALKDYDGTLFVISHDRYFLNKAINTIFELKEDGIDKYLGNYSYYVEKKENPNRFKGLENKDYSSKTEYEKDKKKDRKERLKEKKLKEEFKNIESEIESLEEKKSKLTLDLTREEIFNDINKSLEISSEIDEIDLKLDSLYSSWEEMV